MMVLNGRIEYGRISYPIYVMKAAENESGNCIYKHSLLFVINRTVYEFHQLDFSSPFEE